MAARLPRLGSTLIQSAAQVGPTVRAVARLAGPGPVLVRSFTGSTSSLKQKKAAAVDELEFEEDDLSDFEAAADAVPTRSTSQAQPSPAEAYNVARERLDRSLSQPHFTFRSNLPPVKDLAGLIAATSSSAEVDSTLSLLAKWRARNLPLPARINSQLQNKLDALGESHSYVDALVNKTRFGLELDSPAAADAVALRLGRPLLHGRAKTEAELEEDIVAVDKIRRAVELIPAGERDPIARLSLFSLASASAARQELAQGCLDQLKQLDLSAVGQRVAPMNRRLKFWVKPKLKELAKFAAAKGDKAGAEWATKALASF